MSEKTDTSINEISKAEAVNKFELTVLELLQEIANNTKLGG